VLFGGAATYLSIRASLPGQPAILPSGLLDTASFVPLAMGFTAGLLLLLRSPSVRNAAAPLAAIGRMALSNYLAQSVILSLLFYGYGLGLSGRVGSAPAVLIGLIIYGTQALCSLWWLQRYRFGPVEWLWRSLTYGKWQPIRQDDTNAE
jgi:uncharacterized protein